jgi:hypothetical protein
MKKRQVAARGVAEQPRKKEKISPPPASTPTARSLPVVPPPPHGGKAQGISSNWARLRAEIGAGAGSGGRRTHGPPPAQRLVPQARNGDTRCASAPWRQARADST